MADFFEVDGQIIEAESEEEALRRAGRLNDPAAELVGDQFAADRLPRGERELNAIIQQLAPQGISIDPNFEAGSPNIRFQIARPSNELFAEQEAAILDNLEPGTELISFPVGDDPNNFGFAIRREGEEDFALIDNPTQFTRGDLAGIAGSLASPGAAAAGATELALSRLPGVRATARLGATGLADLLASGAEHGVGTLLGNEQTPIEDASRTALEQAAFGMAAATPFEAAAALRSVGTKSTGEALARTAEMMRSRDLSELAARTGPDGLGFPELGAVDVYPVLQRMRSVSVATSEKARRVVLADNEQAGQAIKKEMDRVNQGQGSISPDELKRVSARSRDRLLNAINVPPRANESTISPTALRGIEDFFTLRRNIQADLDDAVISAAERSNVRFNPEVNQDRVRELLEGMQAPVTPLEGAFSEEAVLRLTRGDITPEQFARLGEESIAIPGTFPKGELAQAMDIFSRMRGQTPAASFDEFTAGYEMMLALRDVGTKFVDETNAQGEIAREFVDIIDETLRTPVVDRAEGQSRAQARREFMRALNEANTHRAGTDEVARGLATKQTMVGLRDNPLEAGRQLISPRFPDRAVQLKRMYSQMPGSGGWEQVKSGYVDRLISNPQQIGRNLDQWPIEARREVFSEAEESALREYGDAVQAFDQTPIAKLAARGEVLSGQSIQHILDQDDRALESLVTAAGGKDSPLGRSLRAGIYKKIFDAAESTIEGAGQIIDPNKAQSIIKRLRDTGRLESIMTPEDIEVLELMDKRISFLPSLSGDFGASLAGTEAATGLFSGRPLRTLGAAQTLTRNELFARVVMTPEGKKLLRRMAKFRGKEDGFLKKAFGQRVGLMRAFAAAVGSASQTASDDAQNVFGGAVDAPVVDVNPNPGGITLSEGERLSLALEGL